MLLFSLSFGFELRNIRSEFAEKPCVSIFAIFVKGQRTLKIKLCEFMFHHIKKKKKKVGGKSQNGWKEGLSLLLLEGRKLWLSRTSQLESVFAEPLPCDRLIHFVSRSPERWCKQGLELLGRGGKSVQAQPSGIGNWIELWPKADRTLQLQCVILFQVLVIRSVSSSSAFLAFFPSLPFFLSFLFFFSSSFSGDPLQPFCAAVLLSPSQPRSDFWKYLNEEQEATATVLVLNLANCTRRFRRKSLDFGVRETQVSIPAPASLAVELGQVISLLQTSQVSSVHGG